MQNHKRANPNVLIINPTYNIDLVYILGWLVNCRTFCAGFTNHWIKLNTTSRCQMLFDTYTRTHSTCELYAWIFCCFYFFFPESGHKGSGLYIFPMLIIRIRLCTALRDRTRDTRLCLGTFRFDPAGTRNYWTNKKFHIFFSRIDPREKWKYFDGGQGTSGDKTSNSVRGKNVFRSYYYLFFIYFFPPH